MRHDNIRTRHGLVRFWGGWGRAVQLALLGVVWVMLTACQHLGLVDSPLPITLNPTNTAQLDRHQPTCHEQPPAKNPAIKNHTPQTPCTPAPKRPPTRTIFLLENWF